jgi:Flp pilus assembly protein TadD
MRKLLAALLLACACAHTQPVEPPPALVLAPKPLEITPAEHRERARAAMAQGRWNEARHELDSLLAQEPKNAAAWFDKGWASERLGDGKAARAEYAKALELQPVHPGAVLNLARLLEDEPAEAERVLRSALGEKNDDPQLLDALAGAQRSQKKLDAAEETVRRVLSRHPRDADAYCVLSAVEADRGHLRLSEILLNDARKLSGKTAGISNSLALLALRRDDAAAARAELEEAVTLNPAFAAAWANLGALALRYRDYSAAEASYAKAIALDAHRWQTRLGHGWALEGLKRPQDARAEYETVLALRPSQEDALYGRAVALRAEGDLPKAEQAFKDYARTGKVHFKEAQGQIVQIELRLKNDLRAVEKPAAAKDAAVENANPTAAKAGDR